MKRRGLSGIYIFEQFEGEPKRLPTCFEDCREHIQDAWLNSLDVDALMRLAKQLGRVVRDIGDEFDLEAEVTQ